MWLTKMCQYGTIISQYRNGTNKGGIKTMKSMLWLKSIRLQENKTHEQVANAINVSRPHYTRIENGTRATKLDTNLAKKIAQELNFDKHGLDWTIFYSTG